VKNNWKWSLFLGIIAAAVIIYLMKTDPYRDQAEAFLRANETLQHRIGTVSKINLRRILVYDGSAAEKAYREYEFSVLGQRGRALVLVRSYAASDAGTQEFFLHKVEAL
jgi:hypothetical protein